MSKFGFLSWFKSRKPEALLLLVPRKKIEKLGEDAGEDAVAAIAGKLLSVGNGHTQTRFLLTGYVPHLSHLKQLSSEILTALVILAHPTKNRVGFATLSIANPLRPEWFATVAPWRLLVAHVCEGASILRRPGWAAVFPQWVSYDSPIYCCMWFDRGKELWATLAEGIVSIAGKSETPSDCISGIRDLYLEIIDTIQNDKREADGDLLNQMYFLEAKSHLTDQ